jgi:FkbM family methyltransferase
MELDTFKKNFVVRLDLFLSYVRHPKKAYIHLVGGSSSLFEDLNNHWFLDLNISTVLDIGANIGQSTKTISELLPNANIYAFEPIPECFRKLNDKFSNDSKVKTINLALGEIDFGVNLSSASSSFLSMKDLHKDAFPRTKEDKTIKVKVDRLDNVAAGLLLQTPIIAKIDVQGFEDRVIKGGKDTLSRCSLLIVETSFSELYEHQALFDDIYNSLQLLGFKYVGCIGQLKDPRNGKILQADSLFAK